MWNSLIHPVFVVDPDRYTGLYMRQPGTMVQSEATTEPTQPKPERREIPEGDIWSEARAVREREELADMVTQLEAENDRLQTQLASTNKHLETARHTVDALTEQNGALEVELQKAKQLLREGIVTFDALKARNEVLESANNRLHEKIRQQGRGEVETTVLVQELRGRRDNQLHSQELDTLLNAGWEVMNLQSNSAWNGHTHEIEHHRIITLKRAKSAPAPQPERAVVREAVPVESNNRVFAGQIVDNIQPEGDPLLNEMEKGRIVSADFSFTQARESGLFKPRELIQIGDCEIRHLFAGLEEEIRNMPPRPPLPTGVRPIVPTFGKAVQS